MDLVAEDRSSAEFAYEQVKVSRSAATPAPTVVSRRPRFSRRLELYSRRSDLLLASSLPVLCLAAFPTTILQTDYSRNSFACTNKHENALDDGLRVESNFRILARLEQIFAFSSLSKYVDA